MSNISKFIQENINLIYELTDKKLYATKKVADYEVNYEILEYILKADVLALKINKNYSLKTKKRNCIIEFFTKPKEKKLEDILDELPNNIYRIKEDFRSNQSYGSSLSGILSKNQVFNEIMK